MKREIHPRITPMRALSLALDMQSIVGRQEGAGMIVPNAYRNALNALISHVRAALARERRK